MTEPTVTKKVTTEEIPCGKCITTEWYDGNNVLVRKDILIEASNIPAMGAEVST